jgi:hypothetical protein
MAITVVMTMEDIALLALLLQQLLRELEIRLIRCELLETLGQILLTLGQILLPRRRLLLLGRIGSIPLLAARAAQGLAAGASSSSSS